MNLEKNRHTETENKFITRSESTIKRYFKLSLLTLSVILGIVGFKEVFAQHASTKQIAITQITSHESLDKVREGTKEGLRLARYREGENLKIIFLNAQSDIGIANQIAMRFEELQPDVIVGITTPSAQTCFNVSSKNEIPLVFASVTDPLNAKLVSSLTNKPEEHVTGTINVSPIEDIVQLIRRIVPEAKAVGLVVNFSEDNAVDLLSDVREVCERHGIKVVVASAENTAMVSEAVSSIVGKVDHFLLLQDNTVASALPSLLGVLQKNAIPVFSSYDEGAKRGALLSLAYDEFDIGIQTGKIVARILDGEDAASIPVAFPQKLELNLNMEVAKKLGIVFPEDLLNQADMVYGNN